MRSVSRTLAVAAALICLATACVGDDSSSSETTVEGADGGTCRHDMLEQGGVVPIVDPDPVVVAATVASTTYRCAPTVVVAPAGDPWAPMIAASVAVEAEAPLLLFDPSSTHGVVPELEDLDATEVVSVGGELGDTDLEVTELLVPERRPEQVDQPGSPGDTANIPGALPPDAELALVVAEHLGLGRVVAIPRDDVAVRTAVPERLRDAALLPLPDDPGQVADIARGLPEGSEVEVLASDPAAASTLATHLGGAGVSASVAEPSTVEPGADIAWLVDPRDAGATAVAAVAAVARDEVVLAVDASDLRAGRRATAALRTAAPERSVLVGDLTADAEWQLEVVLHGPEVPGGGFTLFDGTRMVALYGHPGAPSLGVLGEQDLEATIARAAPVAEPYGADGRTPIPTLEIIATVANSEPGPRGDYSLRESVDVLRRWVDRAGDEGYHVVLDLQPGHSDFLEQAEEYEDLLREPHVGLALDPEWRLRPGERHMEQIGSVHAAEVQRVVDWLAQLTREAGLPQKLLVLHQFKHMMLPDRDTIEVPPELAVVVHMDGQGPQETKLDTYDAVTEGAEDRWFWGWKNFYDEDSPTATPEQVLALEPRPVFVSYQ